MYHLKQLSLIEIAIANRDAENAGSHNPRNVKNVRQILGLEAIFNK